MKTIIALMLTAMLMAAMAEVAKEFPEHWGTPPAIQTHDYVELPGGYGHGSSTLANWIATNLEQDAKKAAGPGPSPVLYENNFEAAEVDTLPDGFMVLNGDFVVKEEAGNRFLELPGTPLDTFSLQFGPATNSGVAVCARILGAARGRRMPTFSVGLGGVAGYKLRVAPAKDAIELLKDIEVQASAPFEWKSGEWTSMRLQIRKSADTVWTVEGKAWQGTDEPRQWMIATNSSDTPLTGRASVLGSPFSGQPIRFDELRVETAKP